MGRKKKFRKAAKAISVNLTKTVAVGSSAYYMFQGVSLSELGFSTLGTIANNFKQNWKEIVAINLGAALLSKALGRHAPKAGIPGAVSIKAF